MEKSKAIPVPKAIVLVIPAQAGNQRNRHRTQSSSCTGSKRPAAEFGEIFGNYSFAPNGILLAPECPLSAKHIQFYLDEFSFRLNEENYKSDTVDRMESLVRGVVGKRLTHKMLHLGIQ